MATRHLRRRLAAFGAVDADGHPLRSTSALDIGSTIAALPPTGPLSSFRRQKLWRRRPSQGELSGRETVNVDGIFYLPARGALSMPSTGSERSWATAVSCSPTCALVIPNSSYRDMLPPSVGAGEPVAGTDVGPMDVFTFRDRLVSEFERFTRSFVNMGH
jgi:hypothetical protein